MFQSRGVLKSGVVEGKSVGDILIDTGCSQSCTSEARVRGQAEECTTLHSVEIGRDNCNSEYFSSPFLDVHSKTCDHFKICLLQNDPFPDKDSNIIIIISEGSVSHINGVWPVFPLEQLSC